MEYHKAIRDKIPEIILKEGNTCKVKTLTDSEFLKKIEKKLFEEIKEYQQNKSVEELADIVEVVYTIVKLRGVTKKEFEKIRIKKINERGSFKKNLFLISSSGNH